MGLFNKMKEMIGIEEIEGDELDNNSSSALPDKKVPGLKPVIKSSMLNEPPRTSELRNSTLPGGRRTDQFKLVVVEPSSFEESPRLVDNLKAKKPVIINLENLETDTARKIFDFLSGATYALNGNVQKVANNIFVFVPENVDVSYNMEQKAGLSDNGMKSPWK